MNPPQLEGIWHPFKAELDGEAAPDLALQSMHIELAADGGYYVRFGDEISDRGHYAIEPGDAHAALILRGVEGPNAGRTIRAIYQLAGDRLRICYGLDGVRPSHFETAGAKQRYSVTYRRRKP
jgi:uncharacterized protein (TIGR03067 family)